MVGSGFADEEIVKLGRDEAHEPSRLLVLADELPLAVEDRCRELRDFFFLRWISRLCEENLLRAFSGLLLAL